MNLLPKLGIQSKRFSQFVSVQEEGGDKFPRFFPNWVLSIYDILYKEGITKLLEKNEPYMKPGGEEVK